MTMADDDISPDTIVEDGKYIPQKTQFLHAAEGGDEECPDTIVEDGEYIPKKKPYLPAH